MLIYRVENEQGEGPYITGDSEEAGLSCMDSAQHPGPRSDMHGTNYSPMDIERHVYRGIYGFRTLEQLCAWFSDHARRVLAHKGYVLAVYDAEDVVHLNKQSIFMDGARLRTCDLVEARA